MQRDHYLPLRVIRDHLDALDRGVEPPVAPGEGPRGPRLVGPDDTVRGARPGPDTRLTRSQLLAATGLDEALLDALEAYGLVVTRRGGGYGADALGIARTAGQLAGFGIEPRHLRAFRTAADREAAWSSRWWRRCAGSAGPSPARTRTRSAARSRRCAYACTRRWSPQPCTGPG